jgi:hypothetical protein
MDNVFAFVAVYDNVHDAESDYEIVKDLHSGEQADIAVDQLEARLTGNGAAHANRRWV